MSDKKLRSLRVLYVTRTPNMINPLIEHIKHLKRIGVDVVVEDNLSGVNARKIGGKSFEYAIVDEVINNEL